MVIFLEVVEKLVRYVGTARLQKNWTNREGTSVGCRCASSREVLREVG